MIDLPIEHFFRLWGATLLVHREGQSQMTSEVTSAAIGIAISMAIATATAILRLPAAFRQPETRPWCFGLLMSIGYNQKLSVGILLPRQL